MAHLSVGCLYISHTMDLDVANIVTAILYRDMGNALPTIRAHKTY